ncbi:MAG: AMP-binding protein [Desulfobacter sp.]
MNNGIWNPIETIPESKFKNSQSGMLGAQLEYVVNESRFYQQKFLNLDAFDPTQINSFYKLPFTTKNDLLQDQVKYPPLGSNIADKVDIGQRIHKTSGTTGQPLYLMLSRQDAANTIECGARCFWASGLRPSDTVIHCMNYCMWAGGYSDHASLEKTGATVIPYGIGQTKKLVELILYLHPTAIHCTPSYLSKIESVLLSEFGMDPKDLKLRIALMGGESGLQNPEFRQRIEETWGIKACNANYGMADVLSMFGGECGRQQGLHFMGRGVLLPELIDLDTQQPLPIEAGTKGELVVTNLCKEMQPLIRYRTGDVIEILSTDECSCGRHSFRFEVAGRVDDMLVIKGINVFPQSVANVVSRYMELLSGEYEILINREYPIDRFIIRLELGTDTKKVSNLWLDGILNDLIHDLAITPQIEFVPYGGLPRTEGKSKRIKRTL